jgi:hypothetical protein
MKRSKEKRFEYIESDQKELEDLLLHGSLRRITKAK